MMGFRRCRGGRLALVLLLALALKVTESAAGQADSGIVGQVTDESGGVLPGVTVTASSPSLQVGQIASVTNERGDYRLSSLPIGTYEVTYTLSGFQSLKREGVRLTVGFVAKVDVSMKVGSLEETITVSGASPVVDVTTTASSTHLTRESMEVVPSSRNGLIGLMAQAPGVRPNVDVGGNTLNSTPNFHAFGQDGESWQTIEGVSTNNPKAQNQGGNYWDYSSFDEAKIETVAHNADVPGRGITVDAVLKSGGNDFHGTVFGAKTNSSLQSNNIDAALAAAGITSGNPIETRSDLSHDLGGRLVRNRLWFYYALRRRNEIDDVVNAFKPDGTPAVAANLQGFMSEKVSYQMTPANRFVGFDAWNHKHANTGASQFVPWDSRSNQLFNNHTGKVEWQAVKGSSLVSSLQFGYWKGGSVYTGYLGQPATTDQVTSLVTGDTVNDGQRTLDYRYHTHGALTWYRPNMLRGSHAIKTGFDYTASRTDRQWVDRGAAGNYQLIFRGGVPFEMGAWNYPVLPWDLGHYLGVFAQDSWTVTRHVTLNLGLRYAHDNGFIRDQCRVAAPAPLDVLFPASCISAIQYPIWNPVSPRLHAAYDMTGDGKNVIKGGWGRFPHMRGTEEVQAGNPNVATTTLFKWHDVNGNGVYDPGEINFNPNGTDFVSTSVQGVGAALANGVPNPNEKVPTTDEYSLSYERELMAGFALRASAIYSKTMNTDRLLNNLRPYSAFSIPITSQDPGPDGKVGTADDPGRTITYYEYSSAYAGINFQQPTLFNDPKADSSYKSFELATSKRLSNRWQLMTSYSATKKHIPLVPNVGTLNGLTIYASSVDPNAEINTSDNTWEWLGRVSGAYIFPLDVLVSANYEYRSGDPFARTVTLTGGKTIPSITLNAEPIGGERYPNLHLLDFRLEKTVRIGGQKLAGRVNLFNALNRNTVTALTVLSGPNFLRPTAILPPRTLEFSATYTF
jgi:carboxypeptidase family protein